MGATLILSTPNSTRAPLSRQVRASDARSFTRAVASAIRAFAASRGVAPQAIEYEIIRGRG